MAHLKASTHGELLAAVAHRGEATIGNNTKAFGPTDEGAVDVELHGHCIARIWPEEISVWSRGYRTTTTKDRLNQFLRPFGARVFAKDFAWYLTTADGTVPFEEGAIVKVPVD